MPAPANPAFSIFNEWVKGWTCKPAHIPQTTAMRRAFRTASITRLIWSAGSGESVRKAGDDGNCVPVSNGRKIVIVKLGAGAIDERSGRRRREHPEGKPLIGAG